MALEANLGLKAERLNVDVATQSILLAQVGVPAAGAVDDQPPVIQIRAVGFHPGRAGHHRRRLERQRHDQPERQVVRLELLADVVGNRSTQDGGLSSFNPRLYFHDAGELLAAAAARLQDGFVARSS